MTESLEFLRSDEFDGSFAISTPQGLRRALARSPAVRAVRRDLSEGTITEATVRDFVGSLMRELKLGEHFLHDTALAAICVVLEPRATDFAEEFLHDLARLRLSELMMSVRVARECLKARMSLTRNRSRCLSLMPSQSLSGRATFLAPRRLPSTETRQLATITSLNGGH